MSVGQDPQEPSPNADSARQIHLGTVDSEESIGSLCCGARRLACRDAPLPAALFVQASAISVLLIPVIAPNCFLEQTFAVW
jgi:hypothetical protein